MGSSVVADVVQSKDESVHTKLKNQVSIVTMTSGSYEDIDSSGKEALLFIFDLPLL